eukprot:CAMPEP_0174385362 /NCGR_PEP_ID=MMETSP0811_2-20130205/126553_1 /TAXON_ID=73025 ORGANISM="Eutreptiella gymnastica-like, Strain CCMP1594" /NCGR_SAMPLE_ID=MMETSP0811_2 /ASSEMBLY_ACC=CAM_ASM_000667 /LENGTH=98 /DNA_ID=CAMNT_0015539659 /DNA_START=168 /DNA_END=464 /DNA_ORIENTATION=+
MNGTFLEHLPCLLRGQPPPPVAQGPSKGSGYSAAELLSRCTVRSCLSCHTTQDPPTAQGPCLRQSGGLWDGGQLESGQWRSGRVISVTVDLPQAVRTS